MGPLQLLAAVGMPLAMAIGGVVAWRRSRRADDLSQQPWHDDSLDEWRRERDRIAGEDRERRREDARDPDSEPRA